MCPACLASLAMAVAGTASTGSLVAVLAKYCIKNAAKEESHLAKKSAKEKQDFKKHTCRVWQQLRPSSFDQGRKELK